MKESVIGFFILLLAAAVVITPLYVLFHFIIKYW
jgi:hypothetical protein